MPVRKYRVNAHVHNDRGVTQSMANAVLEELRQSASSQVDIKTATVGILGHTTIAAVVSFYADGPQTADKISDQMAHVLTDKWGADNEVVALYSCPGANL